jgi:hypothetical protein
MTMITAPDRRARCTAPAALALTLILSGCAPPTPPPPVATAEQPCPPWALFPSSQNSNASPQYFGCVSRQNLRAMVANPADLDGGRPLGPADGTAQTSAVEAYQQDKIKPFEGTSASGTAAGGSGGSP